MKKVVLFLAAAALFAVGCNKEVPTRPDSGSPVRFTAELKYQFDTRATSTAFVEGDRIGIFAGTPIASYNVKGTVGVDGHAVTPETVINWQAGQTSATTFAAYYPYKSDKTPAENSEAPMVIDWAVSANQQDPVDLEDCDLRIAKHADVDVDSPVSFAFTHAFSKIAVTAICNIADASITKVEILDTKREGSVDLVAQTVTTTGDASAITAYHESASSPFIAIILPQTVAPRIRVTVTGNTTYTYSMDGAAYAFEPGKVYNCAIAVNPGQPDEHPVSFEVGAITDWTAGTNNGFTYTEDPEIEGGNVWSVIGTVNNSNWNADFPMTRTEAGTESFQGIWEYTLQDYAQGQQFKLRYGGKWRSEGGYEAGYPNVNGGSLDGAAVGFQLNGETGENGNISLDDQLIGRTVKITFNANNWTVTITPLY